MSTQASRPFAVEIKEARERLGLAQEQWAQRLGVSTRTISRWESGTSEPRTAAQKVTVAQAIRTAGLNEVFPGLSGLAAVGAGIVPLGVMPLGFIGGAVAGAAMAVAAQRKVASRARKKLQVMDCVETAAEALEVPAPRLAKTMIELLDVWTRTELSVEELRDVLRSEIIDDALQFHAESEAEPST